MVLQENLRLEVQVREKLLSVVDSHVQRLQTDEAGTKEHSKELQAAKASMNVLKRKLP